ncbi:MAG: NAD(P)/FAD-dependent oxidoreductase, partial [Gemmatimonadales bacterium]
MTTEPVADVLVIGGGPAGSATALRLSRAGHRVVLLDRARFPREKPCSEYMSPETVRQLDALGVLDTLDAAGGAALVGTTVSGPLGSRLVGNFARAGGTPFRATGLGLPRRVLDHVLLGAARDAGARVLEGLTVHQLVRGGDGAVTGVLARDADGDSHEITARVVVGADGLGSVVARRAGLHSQGRVRRVAFVAHVADVAGLTTTTELHVAREGYVGINDLGGGIANVAVVVPADVAREARGRAPWFFRQRLAAAPALR